MKKTDYFFIIQTVILCVFTFYCCSPWPRRIWIDTRIPDELVQEISEKLINLDKIELTENRDKADVSITVSEEVDSLNLGTWFYAVVVPFLSIEDEIDFSELKSLWTGEPHLIKNDNWHHLNKNNNRGSTFSGWKILLDRDTCDALSLFSGEDRQSTLIKTTIGPQRMSRSTLKKYNRASTLLKSDQHRIVESKDLLNEAWEERTAISVIPFHKLSSEWKVLKLSGFSLLERNKDLADYPLKVHINASGDERGLSLIREVFPIPFSNRDESKMTVLIMTGVTALTRQTAWAMEQNGITWPAKDIISIFKDADYVHTSNEVSFIPDYQAKPTRDTLIFASHDNYIELLEYINISIVEVTGNHLFDYGEKPFLRTLEFYNKRGWHYIGGGKDIIDAKSPVHIIHGPNKLVFLGYIDAGSPQYAGKNTPGPVKKEDWPELYNTISRLKNEGWLPIVCVQDWEIYSYSPLEEQVEDFRALAEAGAVIVQGSHAHQPQAFDFHYGSLIHHGLGNFFFDQMWSLGTRQEFIDKHIFYNGKHLSTVLYTAMLEDFARPRFMNKEEREELLTSVFKESWRNEMKYMNN